MFENWRSDVDKHKAWHAAFSQALGKTLNKLFSAFYLGSNPYFDSGLISSLEAKKESIQQLSDFILYSVLFSELFEKSIFANTNHIKIFFGVLTIDFSVASENLRDFKHSAHAS